MTDESAKARETRLEAAAEVESFESEEAAVRARLSDDPSVSNEDYGRLVEEAADADERRSWQAERPEDERPTVRIDRAEGSHDPILPVAASCRGGAGPYLIPIVDDTYGGVIAWANTDEQAERIVAALGEKV